MTDANYADDLALLANTLVLTKSLQHSLEQAVGGIVNANKTKFMSFKQEGAISTLSGKSLKLVDQFKYLSNNISSTESNVNVQLANMLTAIKGLLIIWKSDLSDKIKQDFFQAMAM